jgi:2,4-dienoyl-CoA reductase-like NADH-dependent reductase (Old Yellow Enzyme family)
VSRPSAGSPTPRPRARLRAAAHRGDAGPPLESPLCIQNYDDAIIPGDRKLAAAIHEEGGTFLAQLAHSAQTGSSSDVGRPRWAPSPAPSDLVQQIPHAMSEAEIAEVVAAFAAAAHRARDGKADMVG